MLPSARETITWVNTSKSSFWMGVPCFFAAVQTSSPSLSPFSIIGKPSTAII